MLLFFDGRIYSVFYNRLLFVLAPNVASPFLQLLLFSFEDSNKRRPEYTNTFYEKIVNRKFNDITGFSMFVPISKTLIDECLQKPFMQLLTRILLLL